MQSRQFTSTPLPTSTDDQLTLWKVYILLKIQSLFFPLTKLLKDLEHLLFSRSTSEHDYSSCFKYS